MFYKKKEDAGNPASSNLLVFKLIYVSTVGNLEVADLASSSIDEVSDGVTENEQDRCQNQNDGNPNDDFNVGRTILTVQDVIQFIHHGNLLLSLVRFNLV